MPASRSSSLCPSRSVSSGGRPMPRKRPCSPPACARTRPSISGCSSRTCLSRAYSLPWHRDLAEQLQAAQRERRRARTQVQMRLPFEASLDDREPKFYAMPTCRCPARTMLRHRRRSTTVRPSTTPERRRHASSAAPLHSASGTAQRPRGSATLRLATRMPPRPAFHHRGRARFDQARRGQIAAGAQSAICWGIDLPVHQRPVRPRSRDCVCGEATHRRSHGCELPPAAPREPEARHDIRRLRPIFPAARRREQSDIRQETRSASPAFAGGPLPSADTWTRRRTGSVRPCRRLVAFR